MLSANSFQYGEISSLFLSYATVQNRSKSRTGDSGNSSWVLFFIYAFGSWKADKQTENWRAEQSVGLAGRDHGDRENSVSKEKE